MLAICHHLQILWTIIRLNPIDMMYNFLSLELAAKLLLHYHAMLKSMPTAALVGKDVTGMAIKSLTALPGHIIRPYLVLPVTFLTTKSWWTRLEIARPLPAAEYLAAVLTGIFGTIWPRLHSNLGLNRSYKNVEVMAS